MRKRNSQGALRIGTSGWIYRHWQGSFYPEGLSQREWLSYFTTHFDTVELNTSFYHVPRLTSIERWRTITPSGFLFAVKCSRIITHYKRLEGHKGDFDFFFDLLPHFGSKLGPVLYQLPPSFRVDLARLDHFLSLLPKTYRATFEFRHDSWFCDEVYELLRANNAAFCIYDFNRRQSPVKVTADFVYLRLHGPDGRYKGSYDDSALLSWARQSTEWREQSLDVYCYFDNDEMARAPGDAKRLRDLITDQELTNASALTGR